ncbi:unnamed protein product [Brassica napus]|uniref:(rape) hypothetical protein n=1 Tax=Brassica napus TaxID=3708 RepID=A0A817B1X5_BRANA|nr:unnamed protein product [Brassica napus]
MIPYSISLSHGNPDSLFLTTRRRHKGDLSLPSAKTTATRDNQAAELGDIIGSGRISNRLLPMYLACMGFGIVALLRGLVSHSTKRSPVLARRKRA